MVTLGHLWVNLGHTNNVDVYHTIGHLRVLKGHLKGNYRSSYGHFRSPYCNYRSP